MPADINHQYLLQMSQPSNAMPPKHTGGAGNRRASTLLKQPRAQYLPVRRLYERLNVLLKKSETSPPPLKLPPAATGENVVTYRPMNTPVLGRNGTEILTWM